MKRSLFLLVVTVAGFFVCHAALAQSVATEPVGFTTTPAGSNSDSYLSVPFTRPPEFIGPVANASGNTIAVSGSLWTPNQFVYAPGSQRNHYFALIGNGGSSNAKEGRTYAIIGNSANSLTLDTTLDNVTGVTANTQVLVLPYWTVGTLFPASDANVSFTPSTSTAALKSQVRVPDDTATGTNLPYLATYYYSSNVDGTSSNIGWRKVGDVNTADHSDDVLLPDSYFVMRHANGAPALPFTALGSVLQRKLTVPLRTATGTPQDNPVSLLRPLDVTLNTSGLTPTDGSFLAGASGSVETNDQLLVFNNAQIGFDKSPSAVYYRDSAANGNWRLVGDNNLTDHGNDVIPLGTGFVVRKAATASGQPAFWTNAFPLQALSAVSRKVHGSVGTFNIDLPLTGTPAIEPRNQGSGYQIVVTFPTAVTFGNASISSGSGSVSSAAGSGTTQAIVSVTASTQQFITVKLNAVSDGVNTNDVAITMGVLVGDVNQDHNVNSGDAIQTRSRAGQATDASNFMFDVNADGIVNGGDSIIVRSRSGESL